jgi:putative tricarboxylic transport membrane protein
MKLAFAGAVLGSLLGAISAVYAQEPFKPTKPVDVVVHTGPGGGADALARAMISIMEKENLLPVRFTIAPRQGGGSTTAMNYLIEKAGDAHTFAVFTSLYAADPLVHKEAKVGLDQLTPIARLVLEPGLVVVKADSPFKTMQDFITAAKANPGKLKQSGGSLLARDAIVRHLLMKETGADWAFISFPSGGERIAAVLGGHVEIMMIESAEAGELVRSGKLRAIAQIADERIEGFPDVPTLREAGFKIPSVPQARGIVGPPDMPAGAMRYYSDLFRKLTETKGWKDYMKQTQNESAYLDNEGTRKFFREYTDVLRDALKTANISVLR